MSDIQDQASRFGLGDLLKKIKKRKVDKEQYLIVSWVNSFVYQWLRANPLVWCYTADGGLLGLLDYDRVDYSLTLGIAKNQEFFKALQEVEKGAKFMRDKLVAEEFKNAKKRYK